MAVRKAHISEINSIITEYVEPQIALEMLRRLRRTEAYDRNSSFRDTIERIYVAIKENLGK